MSTDDITLLVLAVLLILVAGILASIEAAVSGFSKAHAEELDELGRRGAAKLGRLLEDPAPALNTTLLVRLAGELTAAVLVTVVCLHELPSTPLAIVTAAGSMIVISFVVLGVGPRTLGRQRADTVALAGAGLITVLTTVLGPITRLLILIGNALTPGRGFPEGPFASEAELREMVDFAEASQMIQNTERQMIHSVFELGDTLAREVMVPRTDIVFIERTKTLRQALSLALRSGFSRIPVVGDSEDDVVGVAYIKDLTRRLYEHRESENTERVDSVMRPPVFVPDSKPVDALLAEMQAQQNHMVIVVDEYGGTAGLVTIEDVLEEIVGEIVDEYDTEAPSFERLSSGAVRVNARLPIEQLRDLVGVDLDDEDVDSVGGLLAKHLGRVPVPGTAIVVENLRLTAENVEGRRNRLGTVLVEPLEPADPLAADQEGSRSG